MIGESNDHFMQVDLLNGAGKFDTLSPEWYPVSPDSYTSTAVVAGEE